MCTTFFRKEIYFNEKNFKKLQKARKIIELNTNNFLFSKIPNLSHKKINVWKIRLF